MKINSNYCSFYSNNNNNNDIITSRERNLGSLFGKVTKFNVIVEKKWVTKSNSIILLGSAMSCYFVWVYNIDDDIFISDAMDSCYLISDGLLQ